MFKSTRALFLLVALLSLPFYASGSQQEPEALTADVSPIIGPVAPVEPDRFWPILLTVNSQQQTGNQLQLGVAFGGGYFWVTSGGQGSGSATDNQLFRFSVAGEFIDSMPQPNVNSGWGWRDLAFDGNYMYGGSEYSEIQAFNPTTGALVPSMNIPKPTSLAVARALAYDPITDHFWAGNFANNLMEFDRNGNVIWQGSPAPLTAVYGMAWDNDFNGPWLWIYDQSGTPSTKLYQYDPLLHSYTGVTEQLAMIQGLTAQIAGGCEITGTWTPGLKCMVALVQGTPHDEFVVAQISGESWNFFNVTLTPINPPIVIPTNGGNFDFEASVARLLPPQSPFFVWGRIKNPDGSYTPPTLGPVSLNPPVLMTVTRLRTQTVPGSWPAGAYTYLGYANNTFSYPALDSSYFPFTKSINADGGPWIMETSCTGEPFPGEEVRVDQTVIPHLNFVRVSPNPFNPTTTISYVLPSASHVNLKVYDTVGRLVSELVEAWREPGSYSANFDGANLPSGIYMVKLEAENFSSISKMMLVK
jgi:hypothetical protein